MTKAELIAYMQATLPTFSPGLTEIPAPDALLNTESGALDSLGLVTFCFEVEQWVLAATGRKINLVNDTLLAAEPSPFRSLDALADVIVAQLEERS